MREFEFLQPKSIAEAIAMRVEHGDRLVVYNGGTDIVIQLRDRLIAPDYVMDVKKIPGLHEITFSEKEGLFIGACVTMNEIGGNEAVRAHYPFLAEAALSVGSKQVRNRATSVGNIVNASPLCDTGTPLYAADAVMCLEGSNGKREVPIREFITFVRRTVLQRMRSSRASRFRMTRICAAFSQRSPAAGRSIFRPSAQRSPAPETSGSSHSALSHRRRSACRKRRSFSAEKRSPKR